MACRLPAWKRNFLITQRDRIAAQLTSIEDAIDKSISTGNISNYEFQDGEGKQKTTYRNINQLLEARDALELEYERILNRLCCRGVVNLGLNRYRYNNYTYPVYR